MCFHTLVKWRLMIWWTLFVCVRRLPFSRLHHSNQPSWEETNNCYPFIFGQRKMPFATHMRIENCTHTCTRSQSQSQVSTSVSPHISSPLFSTVTYHTATSAARHLLSGSVWRPFNPPSKRSLSCQWSETWPQYQMWRREGGCWRDIRGEGLAEWATQLALHASVGLQPRQIFFFQPERFGNILWIDMEERKSRALSWGGGRLCITRQISKTRGRRCGNIQAHLQKLIFNNRFMIDPWHILYFFVEHSATWKTFQLFQSFYNLTWP